MSVCQRERERETDRQTDRQTETVCLCVRAREWVWAPGGLKMIEIIKMHMETGVGRRWDGIID